HRRGDPQGPDREGAAALPHRAVRTGVRIAILGAGAIGGFLGARLARQGQDVVLIARGPHLAAMQGQGIRLVEAEGESVVRVEATDDFAAMRTADAVFVTLKAHSVPAVAERVAANVSSSALVV